MAKRAFLADILSATVPVKKIRHMSTNDDVKIGPCPTCIDETRVNLRKCDSLMLRDIFPEEDDLWVCESCLATLTELRELKLQKVKIDKRIEQMSSCIKAVVFKKKEIAKEHGNRRDESSKPGASASIDNQPKKRKNDFQQQNNSTGPIFDENGYIILKSPIKYPKTNIMDGVVTIFDILKEKEGEVIVEESELEVDLNVWKQKTENDKLAWIQGEIRGEHCGKRFSNFDNVKQHIKDNDCSKVKTPIITQASGNNSEENGSELKGNLAENVGDKRNPIELFCEKCDRGFATCESVENHICKIQAEKIVCRQYWKHFSNKEEVIDHVKLGKCSRRIQTEISEQSSSNSQELLEKMRAAAERCLSGTLQELGNGSSIPPLESSNNQSNSKKSEKNGASPETVANTESESQLDISNSTANMEKSSEGFEKSDSKIIPRCDVCRRKFPNQQDAILHMTNKVCWKKNYISHRETFDKFCGVCRIGFLAKEDLIRHKVTGVCKKQANFKGFCGHCGKQFYGRSEVFRHLQSGKCRIINPENGEGSERPNICAQVKIEPKEQKLEVWDSNSAENHYDDYFMGDAFGHVSNERSFDTSMQPD